MKNFLLNQSGNVLFLILIVVVLFGALSYAVINSDRVNYKEIDDEKAEIDQAVIDSYLAALNQGQMTLEILRGCSIINYDPPSQWSGSDFNCHMFHPDGAGVAYQDLGVNGCDASGNKEDLGIGESCGGIVYAGDIGGYRLYTTGNDQGRTTWNNGGSNWFATGANSLVNGKSNTDALGLASDSGAPYNAAVLCQALGTEWYLPARNELLVLYQNKNKGALNGTFDATNSWYWSSTEGNDSTAYFLRFSDGYGANHSKSTGRGVRCVRRD